jgi:hypothetical protein
VLDRSKQAFFMVHPDSFLYCSVFGVQELVRLHRL